MKLTDAQLEKYKKDQHCPNCDSNRISWTHQEGGCAYLECDACESRWTEIYKFSHVEDYESTEIKLTKEQILQAELDRARQEIEKLKQRG